MENIVQGQWFRGPSADLGETIGQSLRFSGDGRLVSSDTMPSGNFTVSFWWKQAIGVTNTHTLLMFGPNQAYQFTQGSEYRFASRVSSFDYLSDGRLRDHSAWYHVVLVNNGGTTKMYLNGVQQVQTATTPSGSSVMVIGSNSNSSQDDRLVGHLAEYNFFDGTLLDADDFGRYNDDGVWVPKKIEGEFTSAQYGAKGFRLVFDSSADGGIGDDSAPTGTGHTAANDFTATGFDTTAISSANRLNDIDIEDTPTSNYATFNPLWHRTTPSLKEGNMVLNTANTITGQATFRFPVGTTGKYWVEAGTNNLGSTTNAPALCITDQLHAAGLSGTAWSTTANYSSIGGYQASYSNFTSTSATSYTTAGGQVGMAIDFDAEEVKMYNNSSLINTDTTVDFTKELAITVMQPTSSYNTYEPYLNAGQQAFIQTVPTGFKELQTNNLPEPTIKNGSEHFEVIKGTGTAGFIVYPQPNSPTPTATSAADFESETAIAVTSTYTSGINRMCVIFDTVTEITNTEIDILSQAGGYWGNTTLQGYVSATGAENSWTQVVTNKSMHISQENTVTIPAQSTPYRFIKFLIPSSSNGSWKTNDGTPILTHAQNTFSSGLYMIKGDASSQVFYYIDPINGTSAAHRTPLPTSTASYTAYNGNAYAYCWNCPDTFSATGITSGRRNVTAGFSIVTYDGDNTNPRSIPHGLGRKVGWVILWNPDANDTTCFITGLPGTGSSTENFIWNTTEGSSNQFSAGTQRTPTDVNNFIVGNSAGGSGVTGVNQTGQTYTAFCWAPIPGYSTMGTYSGNGSTDGPFVYCGFKPKWVLIKSQGTDEWHIYDTIRDVNNPCDRVLQPANSGSETDAGGNSDIDILSNGFKLRGTNGAINGGNNYNYVAFAEHPFGGENAPPATAR